MYFFKKSGRQILDLRGNLILTHNLNLTTGRIKSAAPASVRNAQYVRTGPGHSTIRKLRASRAALRFIWARRSQALTVEAIEKEGL